MNGTQFVLYLKRRRFRFVLDDRCTRKAKAQLTKAAFIYNLLVEKDVFERRLVKRICLQWTHCRSKWRQSLHCSRERWMTRGTLSCCLEERWWLFVTKIVCRQSCVSSKLSVVNVVCCFSFLSSVLGSPTASHLKSESCWKSLILHCSVVSEFACIFFRDTINLINFFYPTSVAFR